MIAELPELSDAWLHAKAAEQAANAVRLDIERQIITITGNKKDGQQTVEAGENKITIKTNWTLKLDLQKWDSVAVQIPESLHPIKTERKVDPAGVKWLRENDPIHYAILAQALTITEAKATVDVKVSTLK